MNQNKKYGVWAHVGLHREYQGWAKGGKNLSYDQAKDLAENLRKREIVAYVKPMPTPKTT